MSALGFGIITMLKVQYMTTEQSKNTYDTEIYLGFFLFTLLERNLLKKRIQSFVSINFQIFV